MKPNVKEPSVLSQKNESRKDSATPGGNAVHGEQFKKFLKIKNVIKNSCSIFLILVSRVILFLTSMPAEQEYRITNRDNHK